jgi:hypothetical protein
VPGRPPAEALALVSAVIATTPPAPDGPAPDRPGPDGPAPDRPGPDGPAADGPAPERGELLDALTALRELRDQLAGWEPTLIAAARAAGVSWADLAPALGVSSRQAAERRFLRLQPSGAQDQRTGEERVRDERDRRAGDRAVAAWARRNSGPLRQLAGRIGALEGLPAAAQRQVDVVQVALGDDDASALLHPLAAAGSHLTGTHAELAAQVRTVTDQLDQVRRDTHTQRSADTGR